VQDPKEWDELLGALIEICEPLLERTSKVPVGHVPVRIIDGMFLKSVDTFRAVRLLYGAGLPVQAQALIRILFEVRVDIELFMGACAADPAAAALNVLDAMMLQKISQQRQSKFVGLSSIPGAPTPEKMLNLEKEHGKETARKMRQYGWSGLPIEERAKQVGLNIEYDIVYRNFLQEHP